VDATYLGNLTRSLTHLAPRPPDLTFETRFINHSCDPNLTLVMHRQIPQSPLAVPFLISIRPIAPSEQVTLQLLHSSQNSLSSLLTMGPLTSTMILTSLPPSPQTLLHQRREGSIRVTVEPSVIVEVQIVGDGFPLPLLSPHDLLPSLLFSYSNNCTTSRSLSRLSSSTYYLHSSASCM
jgi:hypothetical protein